MSLLVLARRPREAVVIRLRGKIVAKFFPLDTKVRYAIEALQGLEVNREEIDHKKYPGRQNDWMEESELT